MQKNLLESDHSILNVQRIAPSSKDGRGQEMATETGSSEQRSSNELATEETVIKSLKLFRCHLILFSKLFEFDDSSPVGPFDEAKLSIFDHLKVENLFNFLKIDLPNLSLNRLVSKKLFRETENLIYCAISGLLNYFLFLKEATKVPVTINEKFLEAAEQPLLQIAASAVQGKADPLFFEDNVCSLAKLLMVLVDLCSHTGVKQANQLTPQVNSSH